MIAQMWQVVSFTYRISKVCFLSLKQKFWFCSIKIDSKSFQTDTPLSEWSGPWYVRKQKAKILFIFLDSVTFVVSDTYRNAFWWPWLATQPHDPRWHDWSQILISTVPIEISGFSMFFICHINQCDKLDRRIHVLWRNKTCMNTTKCII